MRETTYSPDYVFQVEKICRLGATNQQVAEFFNVAVSTILRWREKYPEFDSALKAGKIQADAEVADALFQRAKGYKTRETFAAVSRSGEIVTKEIEKSYPPDTTAAIFWLKNRQPDVWANSPDKSIDDFVKEIKVVTAKDYLTVSKKQAS